MSARASRIVRLGIAAGVLAFLTSAGAGAAWGYWSASTSVATTASAATVGVTQQLASGATLALGYDSSTTGGAGAITIKNTSTRDGSYALALSATSASSALLSSVDVAIGTAASCTPTATLSGSVTGTFASTLTKAGTLAAGASVTLCVQTVMTPAEVAATGGTSLTATAAASIAVGSWSATASPIAFVQSVAASAASLGPGWYQLKTAQSASLCVQFSYDGGNHAVQAACQASPDATQLWRFTATSGGYSRIVTKVNGGWWQAASATAGARVAFGTATTTLAEWKVTAVSGGAIQISLRADPTLCLQVPASTSGDQSLTLQTCGPSTLLQRFVPVESGSTSPAPVTLACSTDGYNLYETWPQLAGYQGDVTYRVSVDGRIDTIHGRATGWDPVAQWGSSFATTYGSGSHQVLVEQSVFGGAWTTVGTGTVLVTSQSGPFFQCG